MKNDVEGIPLDNTISNKPIDISILNQEELDGENINHLIHYVTKLRHDFHQYPEVGYQEFRTQNRIYYELTVIGKIPCKNIKKSVKTGLIVDIIHPNAIINENDFTFIGLRADMDALQIEENPKDCKPYRSKNIGISHMCGHDGHMACMLGIAILLQNRSHLLPLNKGIRILFQPAEEGPGGAYPMIKEDNCLNHVKEIYGFHNIPFKENNIYIKSGPVMAHECEFKVIIHGTGGHGALPHLCIDPIIIASNIIMMLQTIKSRYLSTTEIAVLSITNINGGNIANNNVIPDHVTFGGTIRTLDINICEKVKEKMVKMIQCITESNNAKASITFLPGYPPVINSIKETNIINEICNNIVGKDHTKEDNLPLMASEDFGYYLNEIPGCFLFIGTNENYDTNKDNINNNKNNNNRELHSSLYDFNDSIIPLVLRLFLEIINNRLNVSLFNIKEFNLIYTSSLNR